jgi:hypothetical protein
LTFIQWTLPSAGATGLVLNALIANSPQPILSTIYYAYNGIFTCFMLGAEWNGYAAHRKGLRVSTSPRGSQRTSYMLQLPKRMAIPLMILSAVLHWLCSQSIFLVSIDFDHSALTRTFQNGTVLPVWDPSVYGEEEFVTCGYSPIAIVLTISLGVFMVLAPIIVGFRQFKNRNMPVAGSCSASISACCHLPFDETNSVESAIDTIKSKRESEQRRLLDHPSLRTPASTRHSAYSFQSWDSSPRKSYPYDNHMAYSSRHLVTSLKHEFEDDAEVALLQVKWGITNTDVMSAGLSTAVGVAPLQSQQAIAHCGFSSQEVAEPQDKLQYLYQ